MSRSNGPQDDFYAVQRRHAKRCLYEARWVAAVWLATLLVCGTIFALYGYRPLTERSEQPALLLGMPAWVVCGLFIPWLVVIVVTWFFAARVLRDDEVYLDFPNRKPADDGGTVGSGGDKPHDAAQ